MTRWHTHHARAAKKRRRHRDHARLRQEARLRLLPATRYEIVGGPLDGVVFTKITGADFVIDGKTVFADFTHEVRRVR